MSQRLDTLHDVYTGSLKRDKFYNRRLLFTVNLRLVVLTDYFRGDLSLFALNPTDGTKQAESRTDALTGLSYILQTKNIFVLNVLLVLRLYGTLCELPLSNQVKERMYIIS